MFVSASIIASLPHNGDTLHSCGPLWLGSPSVFRTKFQSGNEIYYPVIHGNKKAPKTRVVVMVTNAKRQPYIDLMKSSSDNYKVDVEMSPCIVHHYFVLVLFITPIPLIMWIQQWLNNV